MAADRTVPCDHSIRRESTWKAESVIGWSAAQRELGGAGCPNCNQMAKFLFWIPQQTEVEIGGGEKVPTIDTWFHLLHSSQGLQAAWGHKKVKEKPRGVSSFPSKPRVSSLTDDR